MKSAAFALPAFVAMVVLQPSAQAAETRDTVISVENVNEGDVTVGVPTVRRADGAVCVGYISAASYDEKSELRDVRIARICGPAQFVSHVVRDTERGPAPTTTADNAAPVKP
ncbi:hypothetical protein [Paraburkholderia youngii]|uniref:hypothetical protein n=1 Tax=Paraburkholderia youngii TaxID=2782701 RepID=UPI003D2074D2